MTNLAAALSAMQAEIRNPARSKNGQVRGKKDYQYVPLDDLLDLVRAILPKHGLSVSQPVDVRDGQVGVRTVLMHASGESLEGFYPVTWDGNAQERGSEITYARRYSLESIIGVAATEDDDGAGSAGTDPRPEPRPDPRPEPRAAAAPAFDEREVLERLKAAGLVYEVVRWWSAQNEKPQLDTLAGNDLHAALNWITSPAGAGKIHDDFEELRGRFRTALMSKWSALYPTPRKKDGATDEAIAAFEAKSETDRRAVMLRWYGVRSLGDIGPRAMLQSERSLTWLRNVRENEFEGAVKEALAAPF